MIESLQTEKPRDFSLGFGVSLDSVDRNSIPTYKSILSYFIRSNLLIFEYATSPDDFVAMKRAK